MKIFDLHNDFFTELKSEQKIESYLKKINRQNNILKICSVIWTTNLKNPIKFLKHIYLKWFVNKEGLSKKLLLCIEDLGFVNYDNYYEVINLLKEIKPFYCGICWNYDNNLCGGALGKNGITNLGKKLIIDLENLNIQIDTAHMNRKSFYEFAKITKRPILCSHTNLWEFKNFNRNITPNQVKKIEMSNGLIGLCFVQHFASNFCIDPTIIAKQIKYYLNKYAYKSLSIGSDFYGTKNLPTNLTDYKDFFYLETALAREGIKKNKTKQIFVCNALNFYNNVKSKS